MRHESAKAIDGEVHAPIGVGCDAVEEEVQVWSAVGVVFPLGDGLAGEGDVDKLLCELLGKASNGKSLLVAIVFDYLLKCEFHVVLCDLQMICN